MQNEKRFFDHKLNFYLFISLIFWVAFYSLTYFAYFYNNENYKLFYLILEHASSIIEILFDFLLIYLGYKLFHHAEKNYSKYLFYLYFSFLFMMINDLSFYILYQILKIQGPKNYYNLFYFLPFFFYLLFQLLFWFLLLRKYILHKNHLWILFVLTLFGITLMFVFVVTSSWKIHYFSYTGIYELITGVMEVVLFYLAALGLICSTNNGVYLLTLSSMMIVATNFWEKYLFQLGQLSIFDYSDAFWCLSQILGIFGLLYLLKTTKINSSKWFHSFRHIKSQIALSAFLFTLLTFLIIVFIGLYFNFLKENTVMSLPFIIMTYPLGVLIISNYMGNRLKLLFRKIQRNIELFMDKSEDTALIESDFSTEEFIFLQKFVFSMFRSEKARNEEKKKLAELAAQVAHDIRSPVAAILMFSKESLGLPENQRILLRNSANRIQNIANNLLNHYEGFSSKVNKVEKILAAEAVASVFSEKEIEYQHSLITFKYNVEGRASFIFIETNKIEFERIISNLINNAVESLNGSGKIEVKLVEKSEHIVIRIIDDGCGIPQSIISKIVKGEQVTSKKRGYGLGMLYMRTILKKYNANFKISSVINRGTEVELLFPINKCPVWIAKEVYLRSDSILIILDDDESIHSVWDSILYQFLRQYKLIVVLHCKTAEQCLEHIRSLSKAEIEKVILLSDYELIHQTISGIDVIKLADISNSILVTSHYENVSLIKEAILLNTKILPKMLTSDVQLYINDDIDNNNMNEVDLVIIENTEEFADILSYLYAARKKKLISYSDPFEFLSDLKYINKQTKICFDYDLDLPVNGIELAAHIWNKGYENLYLATGYNLDQSNLPSYLTLLKNKMDLLEL